MSDWQELALLCVGGPGVVLLLVYVVIPLLSG